MLIWTVIGQKNLTARSHIPIKLTSYRIIRRTSISILKLSNQFAFLQGIHRINQRMKKQDLGHVGAVSKPGKSENSTVDSKFKHKYRGILNIKFYISYL